MVSELQQIKDLLDRGVITHEDFLLKKADFLKETATIGDLRALAELRDAGAITQEEFTRKKNEAIGGTTTVPAGVKAGPARTPHERVRTIAAICAGVAIFFALFSVDVAVGSSKGNISVDGIHCSFLPLIAFEMWGDQPLALAKYLAGWLAKVAAPVVLLVLSLVPTRGRPYLLVVPMALVLLYFVLQNGFSVKDPAGSALLLALVVPLAVMPCIKKDLSKAIFAVACVLSALSVVLMFAAVDPFGYHVGSSTLLSAYTTYNLGTVLFFMGLWFSIAFISKDEKSSELGADRICAPSNSGATRAGGSALTGNPAEENKKIAITWVCRCGARGNTGSFCASCGKQRGADAVAPVFNEQKHAESSSSVSSDVGLR